ncbi:MAG TPA: FAD-dependent monooxygenase [Acetobacteraceae bacterium]|nr:FAD-dependent monooxygenase [Acetobacteraceae bacterium]
MRAAPDVLIVGAGPVGLLLATELARDGVDALLIDHLSERSFFCKALGVTPRTLEIFEDIGIVHEAIDLGVWLSGVTEFEDGKKTQVTDLPSGMAIGTLPYGFLSLAQFDTERLLESALRRHGGCVDYGWTLASFVQDAEHVRATLRNAAGEIEEVSCRWLVGSDGAHSTVRSALGLAFEGGSYPQTFVLADLEVRWDLKRGPMYRFTRSDSDNAAPLAAVPVHGSPGRYRLSTIMPETAGMPAGTPIGTPAGDGTESPEPPDLEGITEIMTPLLPPGTTLSSLHWSSVYRVSHRIVPRYGEGRVFLAGDAAHIHPPVGGQGMNTGLQDAHNLAWKLALAARSLARPSLLETYTAERQPVGRDVVEQTSRALDAVMARESPRPGIRESQLPITYRGSALVRDDRVEAGMDAPTPGDRAPDVDGLRRPFVTHALRLHERLGGGRYVLFGLIGENGEGLSRLADMADVLRGMLGASAAAFAVAPKDAALPAQERIPVLEDAAGAFRATYGPVSGTAWLTRPDGHIGWRGTMAKALADFLATILVSSGPVSSGPAG